jgi:hypothetical protein
MPVIGGDLIESLSQRIGRPASRLVRASLRIIPPPPLNPILYNEISYKIGQTSDYSTATL